MKINFGRITRFRMRNSGNESAVTAIMKANTVPSGTPFSNKTFTRGIIPAAFEYNGIPIKVANGTPYHLSSPA